jgi:hypothetical protein
MAQVPSSPTKLSDVQSIFGGTGHLLNYLRGGVNVYDLPTSYPNVAAYQPLRLAGFAGTIHPPAYLPSTIYGENIRFFPNDAYAWVTVSADGTYSFGGPGAGTTGTWKLVPGSASEFDVAMWYSSGNLFSGDSVNAWLSLGTSRTWFFSITGAASILSGVSNLQIREHNTSQRAIVSATTTLYAEVEPSCGICCFTPETLVTMADYTTKPIIDIRVGDFILVRGGSKKVTEVITRQNRVMYRIRFFDGRILNASDEHPLYVVGKGYSAINPVGVYKDLGMADELVVGDRVLDEDSDENEIVEITEIDYPHTVYTFAESEFYANGMLVY